MAKSIVWSARAKEEKRQILQYWLYRNRSNVYPKKLNNLLKIAIKSLTLGLHPKKKTDYGDALVKIVSDYLIIYEEDEDTIYILSIWDTRQNPDKLKDALK